MKNFNWQFVLAIIASLISVLLVVELVQSGTALNMDQTGLDMEAYRSSVHDVLTSMTRNDLLLVPIAWILAAFVGAMVGSVITRDRRRQIFFVVALFTLSAAVMFMLMFQPPSWVWIAVIFIFPSSLLGSRLIRRVPAKR
ncbi:MAG: hypothetical protein H6608_06245 [Flavobacteriales bacterium]|nr:hypothetical protein [Bacteroidota bacterium]MCB9240709.1 hypothetical protein [Flavobacteriales bacterium]